jgi:hypothetical protein
LKGKSTTTNHLIFRKYVLYAFASGYQVDVNFTNFAKAFDKINHNILSIKLYSIGIPDPFLSWLTSYLTNKMQIVKLKNFHSSLFNIPSSVPQESHLAPLLFYYS